ncbi:MAG TPA: Gfo/Idh/MocA family oxidoreductase [Bacteroidota bacterium]|nr:Gfo/Idh/MocA family oxidoreductase [Bacteroidota bacterium]
MAKINWGVLSTARIGTEKVIPAMQRGQYTSITAIASRKLASAQQAAKKLGIAKAYGSYEELLADDDIQAIYISLPNHLHVEWTLKALRAGKHVLCEKPIAINARDAEYLQEEAQKFPKLKLMEAFMYRHHPQTIGVKKLVDSGAIGEVRHIHAMFSYYNDNPQDIRNQADIGGGGLLDIGCYCISLSRFLFDVEPQRVCGAVEYDPKMRTDRLVSGILDFPKGSSTFSCSTQLPPYQYAKVFGTQGFLEIETPFTPAPDRPSKVIRHSREKVEEIVFAPYDHYTIQGDSFSRAILENAPVPTPIEDGVANMKVIDGISESSRSGSWVEL